MAAAYGQRIARVGDFLVTYVCGRMGCSYLYPAGSGDMAGIIRTLGEDAARRRQPLRLVCLTGEQVEQLETLFPGRFAFAADRDGYDYLYEIDRLADLGGKKLHAKRNHINRFVENNPSWVYEPITPESLSECLEMDREWYRRSLQREGEAEERDLGDEGMPCAPPWSITTPWAWRGDSSGSMGRWWPSPWGICCALTPMTSTLRRPTGSSRGPTPTLR